MVSVHGGLAIKHQWHGRRLKGTGGTAFPNFEVGDSPCIRPPIFGEVMLSEVW